MKLYSKQFLKRFPVDINSQFPKFINLLIFFVLGEQRFWVNIWNFIARSQRQVRTADK